jgi:hypothetical protein
VRFGLVHCTKAFPESQVDMEVTMNAFVVLGLIIAALASIDYASL